MATRYLKINESIDARVHDGYLYVRLTGMRLGMLVQGERAGRVYRMPYTRCLLDAVTGIDERMSAVDRAMDPNHSEIVNQGRLIR